MEGKKSAVEKSKILQIDASLACLEKSIEGLEVFAHDLRDGHEIDERVEVPSSKAFSSIYNYLVDRIDNQTKIVNGLKTLLEQTLLG